MHLHTIAGVNGNVLMLIRSIDPYKLQRVQLTHVDDSGGGVWIKSAEVQSQLSFKNDNLEFVQQSIELFLPFQEIVLIVAAESMVATDEKAAT
jgi:hypothetical protein